MLWQIAMIVVRYFVIHVIFWGSHSSSSSYKFHSILLFLLNLLLYFVLKSFLLSWFYNYCTVKVLINGRKLLSSTSNGRGIILSSGASSMMNIRAPYDAANLMVLFGIRPEDARKFISGKHFLNLLLYLLQILWNFGRSLMNRAIQGNAKERTKNY